jgi:3-oxoacyl-(acyl-carrier-protein) synthase
MAVFAARQACEVADWSFSDDHSTAVNVGCSRGATGTLESFHSEFLRSTSERSAVLCSPLTTGGTISSAVIQSLLGFAEQSEAFGFSHSATCSSALLAIGNAMAWLSSGMCSRFVAGGAEAPLTRFTVAQMRALRIYAENNTPRPPCRPLAREEKVGAGMVLGEGAAVFTLERRSALRSRVPALATVLGFGSSSERLSSPTGISPDGANFRRAMRGALRGVTGDRVVDLVILHAPGTSQGDQAELAAVREVFGSSFPMIVSNKWQVGHTLGASGALSLEYALQILQGGSISSFPYAVQYGDFDRPARTIMINSAGFGGNAVSLLVGREDD